MKNLYGLSLMLLAGFMFAASVAEAASSGSGAGFTGSSQLTGREPADTYYQQAEKRIDAEDWKGAIALLEKSLARNSRSADAQNLLGYCHRKLGDYDRAFEHYARALELDPKHLGAHEYVGEAYLKVENLEKAKEHLDKLGRLCAYDCPEYRDLQKHVIAYEKARKGDSR